MVATFRASGNEIVELARLRSLLFWIYAFEEGTEGPYRVEEAGSGVLFGKEQGLTARHVTQAFTKFDPQFEALQRSTRGFFPRRVSESVQTAIPIAIYGDHDSKASVEWRLRVIYQSIDTDISVLVLWPTPDQSRQRGDADYLPWQLLPPRLGAHVRVYGFPRPKIDIDGPVHSGSMELWMRRATVVEHAPTFRDHGFCHFPGYVLDVELPPGMSGAAVVHEGRLAGIFTGPDYVSSLWPLALIDYPVTENVTFSFAEHFDTGIIDAVDWDRVKGRVERRRECSFSDCLRTHIYLR
jgi:hypothetical protein